MGKKKLVNNPMDFQKNIESNAATYVKTIDKCIDKAKGSSLFDTLNKEYIDFLTGAGTLALGHNNDEIINEISSYLESNRILHGLDMFTPAKHNFINTLVGILPEKFKNNCKIHFCGPTGTDATEAAMKLFRISTKNRTIISFHGAYHGMSLGSMSLTGNLSIKKDFCEVPGIHFFPFPYEYRNPYSNHNMVDISLSHIRSTLTDTHSGVTKPAAIFVEAIQGEGGCIPAPVKWLRGLRKIADDLEIPLVLDEIQSGLGRTGKMFAFEHANIIPDAILLSKAIGGGLPLSVLVYNKKYDKWDQGAHTGTFRGNQLAMIAGEKTLNIIKEPEFLNNVQLKSQIIFNNLMKAKQKFPFIGDIRGYGLMIGIEIIHPDKYNSLGQNLANSELAKKIKKLCFENGLIIETGGRSDAVLRFLPALNITNDKINQALAIFNNVLLSVGER